MARRGRRQRTAPPSGAPPMASPPPDGSPPGQDERPLDTSDPAGAPPPEPTQAEQDAGVKQAPEPSLEDVEKWCRADREHWQKRDQRMQRHHKLWRLDKPQSDRVSNMLIVTTNDPKVFIEKATGMVVTKDHRIEVPPKGEQNLSVAERIENGCRWFRSFQRREWRQGGHNYLDWDQAQCLFLRGWLTVRMMLDDATRTFVDETLFDPMTVYPRFGNKRVRRVCHVYKTTVAELRDDFGELPEILDLKDDDATIDVKSVYVGAPPYWHAVVVDGNWVKEPARLGYFPWLIHTAKGAFSHHASDFESASDAAEHVGQGFLDTIEDAYRDLNDLLTIGMNLLAKQENPPLATVDPNGKPLEISTEIGGRTPLATGQDFKAIEVGARLQNVEAMLTAFQDRENKGAFPGVAWGEGAGIQSGYQGALLLSAIDHALVAYLRCLEGFHSARYEKWLTLLRDHGLDEGVEIIAKVGATIDGKPAPKGMRGRRAWGTTLTPKDLEANGTDVDVIYEDISPQDRLALANQAVQLVGAGILDLTTAREKYVGLDNADVINERVLADLIYKDQSVVQLLSELALRRTGRWNELTALRASDAQQGAMGAGGGPPGAPGAPPAGPQGSPVHEAMNFKDLPPALQAQMAAQAGMQMEQSPGGGAMPPPGPGAVAAGSPIAGASSAQGPVASVPPQGPPPQQLPSGVTPEQMAHAQSVFQTLPPQVQQIIGGLPIAVAIQLLGLPPQAMLQQMAGLAGHAGQGGARPPAPQGTPPEMGLGPAQTGPASAQQLQAARMQRVGLIPARR